VTRQAHPPSARNRTTGRFSALSPGADAASLKRAFRQQARRWHPISIANDPVPKKRFKLVNEGLCGAAVHPKATGTWEAGLDPLAPATPPLFLCGRLPAFEDYLGCSDLAVAAGQKRRLTLQPFAGESGRRLREDGSADSFGGGFWRMVLGDDVRDMIRGASGPTSDFAVEPDPPYRGRVTHGSTAPPPVTRLQPIWKRWLSSRRSSPGGKPDLELSCPWHRGWNAWTPPIWPVMGWRLRLAGVASGGGYHFLQLRVRHRRRPARGGRLRVFRFQLEVSPPEAALAALSWFADPAVGASKLRALPPGLVRAGRLPALRGRAWRRGEQRVTVGGSADHGSRATNKRKKPSTPAWSSSQCRAGGTGEAANRDEGPLRGGNVSDRWAVFMFCFF